MIQRARADKNYILGVNKTRRFRRRHNVTNIFQKKKSLSIMFLRATKLVKFVGVSVCLW